MKPPVVGKFGSRIRTREGIVIDIALPGRGAAQAERKPRQICRERELPVGEVGQFVQPVAGLSGRPLAMVRQS